MIVLLWGLHNWSYQGPDGQGHWLTWPPDRQPGSGLRVPGTPSDQNWLSIKKGELKRRFGIDLKFKVAARAGRKPQPQAPSLPKGFDIQRFLHALDDFRQREELSQRQLGERLEPPMSQAQVSTLLRGVRQPSTEELVRWQTACGWIDYYGTAAPPTVMASPPIEEEPPPESVPEPEQPKPEPVEVLRASNTPLSILDDLARLQQPVKAFDAEAGYPRAVQGISEMMRELTSLRSEVTALRKENRGLHEELARAQQPVQSVRRRRVAVA